MAPQTPLYTDDARLDGPIHAERPVKIVCIGAGASGLMFAYKLQRSFRSFELTVYEKNPNIGGTWLENKYPGCACDIPAHNYTYSFEGKTDWSAVYAGSAEIYEYFNNFVNKHDLRKYCKFDRKVTAARWDEKAASWNIEVTNTVDGSIERDRCDFLINGMGLLNTWKWPVIPGLHDFKGKLLHTANWDTSFDVSGKRVGVIGNGSSAIQVVPAIQPQVTSLTTFVRGPTWVAPVQGMEQRAYTAEEKERFSKDPNAFLDHRKGTERHLNGIFSAFIQDSDMQTAMRSTMVDQMKGKLHDTNLQEKLIPNWAVGCRRITPGVGYLESLGKENVRVVYGQIQQITEKGCVDAQGEEHVLDVLVCATGFDTSYRPQFPLVGLGGKNLANEWAKLPNAYLGLAVPDFPNYFIFMGPNTPVGNGPFLKAMEAQADYMLKFIDRWQTENIHSFAPKPEAVEDFIAHKDHFMEKTVWKDGCHSWYKGNSITGKVTALWPGSTLHFLEAVAIPRFEDWNFKYNGNRFNFFGNGFSQTELDHTADWAYYIKNGDDEPYLSRAKQREVETKSGTMDFHIKAGAPIL